MSTLFLIRSSFLNSVQTQVLKPLSLGGEEGHPRITECLFF